MTKQQRIQAGLNEIRTFWDDLTDDAKTMIESTDFDTCEMFIDLSADDLNDLAREFNSFD